MGIINGIISIEKYVSIKNDFILIYIDGMTLASHIFIPSYILEYSAFKKIFSIILLYIYIKIRL